MADDVRHYQAKVLTVARNASSKGPAVLINIIDGGKSGRADFAQARTFLDELEQLMTTRGGSDGR